jgi:enoyl-CoA hydratase/carnithine racemase
MDRDAGKAGDRRGQRLRDGRRLHAGRATDLRVACQGAVFEVSEAKRWLLGGYNHGHLANLPYPIAMEMALGFRFTAERFHEVGFLNRLVPSPTS